MLEWKYDGRWSALGADTMWVIEFDRDTGVFSLPGHEWPSLAYAKAWCESQEQIKPAETRKAYYVASRASVPARSEMWRRFRDSGVHIVSTWIDESGDGETGDFSELWSRIDSEIAQADALVLYAEPGDFPLKGALIEVGIAMGRGKPITVCLPGVELEERSCRPLGSWINHASVVRNDDIASVFGAQLAQPAEPLPEVGSVWGVVDKPDTWRLVVSSKRTEVCFSSVESSCLPWWTIEAWHRWVRETGAVDLIADREALQKNIVIACGERDHFMELAEATEIVASKAVAKAADLKKRAETAEHQRNLWEQDSRNKAAEAERWKKRAEAAEMIARVGEKAADVLEKRAETAEHQRNLWEQDSRNKAAEAERWKKRAEDADKERDDLRAEVCRLKSPVEGEPKWLSCYVGGPLVDYVRTLIRERDRYAAALNRIISECGTFTAPHTAIDSMEGGDSRATADGR